MLPSKKKLLVPTDIVCWEVVVLPLGLEPPANLVVLRAFSTGTMFWVGIAR